MHRLAALSLLFCATIATYAQTASSENTDAVVRRYIQWRGGAAFQALRSIHLSGNVMDGGLAGTKQVWLTRQGVYWERRQTGSITTVIAVQGDNKWRTNLSGQPIQLSENEAMHYERDAAVLFAGIFAGELAASVEGRPDEIFEGSSYNVFRVSFGDADTYDFLVTPKTGELRAIRTTVDRHSQLIVYAQWQPIAGVEQPFVKETRSSNQASQSSFSAQSILANEPLESALFQEPQNPIHLIFSDKSDWSGWIKFEFVDGKRIFVPAQVNGRNALLLLDSGAETTVLGRDVALGAGINCTGQIGVEGPEDRTPQRSAQASRSSLAKLQCQA